MMFFAGVFKDWGVFDGVRSVRMTFRMVSDIIWMGFQELEFSKAKMI